MPVRIAPPVKRRDPAFDAETEFYAESFSVTAPVRINPHAAPGRQAMPVSVRFQTCNGDICQPPKTVRLVAPLTARIEQLLAQPSATTVATASSGWAVKLN